MFLDIFKGSRVRPPLRVKKEQCGPGPSPFPCLPAHLWGSLRPVPLPSRSPFPSWPPRVIIFAPSSLDVPSSIWVDCRAHVILGQCNHLAMYQHTGQCLAREQLLLVPGLRRQGAECSQASVLHTKIIPGSQPCLGNMARIGAGTAQTTLAYQATSSQLYTNGRPVSSSPGGLMPLYPKEECVRPTSDSGCLYEGWLCPRVR